VLYLPPYSPEFNRIEKCSAWLKSRIRKQLHHHWEGVLYPHQLPPRQELDCYIQHYQTVEVNSTYYRRPPNATFAFLAFAPPPRISDDRKSAPWSLRTPSIFTRQSRSHPRVGKSGATCVRLLQQRRRGKCSSERFWAKNFCGERYFLTDSD
jgi:hypothetical protein